LNTTTLREEILPGGGTPLYFARADPAPDRYRRRGKRQHDDAQPHEKVSA
jgi:hypothetical protein